MFTMSKGWEKTFFFFSWIMQGSAYLSPNTYGILHRQHHAYADTEEDPHSPKYDNNLMSMMWRTKNKYNDIFYGRDEADEQFTRGVAQWDAFDKFANRWSVRLSWIAAYTAFYYFFATEWWMWLFLPINILTSPLHGAVINWFAHKYGYVNFKVKDTSKNFLPLDVLMLGESYHNNHHGNSADPNFGHKWWEIDPVYPFIWLFDKVGIIQLKKKQTQPG